MLYNCDFGDRISKKITMVVFDLACDYCDPATFNSK